MVKYIMPLVIFLGLAVLLWVGIGINSREEQATLLNRQISRLELPDLYNTEIKLDQTLFANKVSVLNVWATWCKHCKNEHQFLVELKQKNTVQMIGLNYRDDAQAAKDLLANHGNPYHAVLADFTGDAMSNWGVDGIPETFIIDKKGIIRYQHDGELTQDVWEQDIMPVIAKINSEG